MRQKTYSTPSGSVDHPIAPLVFATVVSGITSTGDSKEVGRIGLKALAWFVTACQAADGSYWALQSWQRALPDYGVTPTPTTMRSPSMVSPA